jgi:hypothetical protein
LQFLQIKDAMLKQLEISDIDPMIAKLEQGYSDKGHTQLNIFNGFCYIAVCLIFM